MISSYLDYKRLTEKAESFLLDERVAAQDELDEFRKHNVTQARSYDRWLQEEMDGINPITGKAVNEPVSKPVEAVKTARGSNNIKTMQTVTRGKDKPKSKPMTYEQFIKEFNALDKTHLFRADGKSPVVRLSEFSREHPDLYAKYRDQMRENDD